ncbi:bifunctional diaminohydroxyphosphoribosylaminopyrimidine deaminase/5-amino-6-(5-phosphoribosylamino)uracil reductase RibD [Flavobacterium frigidarium]|uniref:bifunctional diaminohydroxyphosphoribosylaminopyrimidine deaminase/5-amino-6-(5-phosphoribosylamino)uracil reductase RibD n=1 Tax=Flavobacterium frigidarium TaxID=99286 RepID=UPI00047E222E|nr:bifunctional diaminohydroxyphosphoribosylaminopyrimidine deaminase/5-amino-6-(5-phosphoribosylamino)uracil reductase RibD [Flavobacterium frigidarium]
MNIHEKYIQRCITLAKNGLGTTYPNPMVGSVIVYDNKIIGEGWHKMSGEGHAEVNAINSVKDKSLLKKATIYVSLEPCSHFGRTPPCCELIIKHEIPYVVVGTVDPNIQVAGNGIKRLVAAGAKVTVGVLEKECISLNKRFFTFHLKKRPYIILKWAESLDGFIAPETKDEQKPVWITNSYSRQLVHKWRSEEQAILVGTKTVLDDNPKLDVRDWSGSNPVRVVIDLNNRIPQSLHVHDGKVKTIFITATTQKNTEMVVYEKVNLNEDLPNQIATILYRHQLQSVIIEGGQKTIQTFIDANLWDEARVFKGNVVFTAGTVAPTIQGKEFKKHTILNDEYLKIDNHD